VKNKKIALFGGSGRTGQHVLERALDQGFEIKALARTPSKISQTHPRLEVIQGDVLNANDVLQTVKDADAVVSLFGHVKGSPKRLQTRGTKNIIQAMKEEGVKKIISLSGGGLPFPEKDQPKFMDKAIRFIMKLAVPKVLNDAIEHAEVLKESKLDWIIVRAPRLTEEPKKGEYRVGWVGVNASTKIGRADLAPFIVDQINDDTFVEQMPFVSY
jgi:putative NADH-flavin reductase